ncbi:MAG: endonuclease NucS domain-containing protein [Candidatus Helarchaeota archaeon]
MYVWQMVKEAIENLDGKATYSQIKDYIKNKFGNVNENTITCQIIVCTVNHTSRVHYPENKKPRIANTKYDFLFSTGRGQVELYSPEKHGTWEIRKDDFGKLIVAQTDLDEFPATIEENYEEDQSDFEFALENHLRDFIVQNIEAIKIKNQSLRLYVDENNRDGVEYPTEVGIIDILATDESDDFIVFELKVSRGVDRALGQILRYIGWVKKNIAKDKEVKGVIVAKNVDKKLKLAASVTPNITLIEYGLDFKIKEIDLHND